MLRFLSGSVFSAALVVCSVHAASGEPNPGPPLFLGERIALIPAEAGDPDPALPRVVARFELGPENLHLTLDCDLRNVVAQEDLTPPYRARISLSGPDGTTASAAIDGRWDGGEAAIHPNSTSPAAESAPDPASWKALVEPREDGIWRMDIEIPRESWDDNWLEATTLGLAISLSMPTGRDNTGTLFGPAGEQVLWPEPGSAMALQLRPITPVDISEVLRSAAGTDSEACQSRALNRLFRLATRDDTLHGAIAMAMEHEDTTISHKAARVWLWYPDENLTGLETFREQARRVLGLPEPEPDEKTDSHTD